MHANTHRVDPECADLMRVFGHGTTGGTGHAINTRESFIELALLTPKIDGVELDVRRSADDELVVIHDDCYVDGRRVVDVPAASRPSEVLLLADALALCSGMIVNIELKNHPREETFDPDERIADLCAALLDARGGIDEVLISCFGLGCLDRVIQLRPQTPTALLLLSRRPAEELIVADVSERHRTLHPYVSMVDAAFMERSRSFGLCVNAWGAGDETEQDVRALIDLGVDGFITEAPERVVRIRGSARGDQRRQKSSGSS